MRQLKPKIKFDKKWQELNKDTECHLDPDICPGVVSRMPNWKPCFGQINQAQSHLVNEGVKENDLFLFFGWFKKTVSQNDVLKFDEFSPDLHVIFGYLQVGQILQVNERTDVPNWMQNHPHARNKQRKKTPTNTIYVARENLSWDKSKPGAWTFEFNESLVLTKKGFSRSKWELPAFFKRVKISRHTENAWKKKAILNPWISGKNLLLRIMRK